MGGAPGAFIVPHDTVHDPHAGPHQDRHRAPDPDIPVENLGRHRRTPEGEVAQHAPDHAVDGDDARPGARAIHDQPSDHRAWFRMEDFSKSRIRAQMFLFRKHCASNPLNYLALLWSWLGLLIWHGLIRHNKVHLRGTLQGMTDVLRGDESQGGSCPMAESFGKGPQTELEV